MGGAFTGRSTRCRAPRPCAPSERPPDAHIPRRRQRLPSRPAEAGAGYPPPVSAGDPWERARTLAGPVLAVECEPGRHTGRYECLAIRSRVARGERNAAGALGHPFIARVDFENRGYAFCKVEPPPGEKAIRVPTSELPEECT